VYDDDEADDDGLGGLSVMSASAARDALLAPGDSMQADVANILAEWQEAQAVADDGTRDHGSLKEQARMMASWRELIAEKERDLLKAKRKTLDIAELDGAVPAYLTGWLMEDEDPKSLADELGAFAADEFNEQAVEALVEAETETADAFDQSFVAEWQLHAEKAREAQSRQRAGATAAPAAFFERWQDRRRGEYGSEPVFAREDSAIGIDLGTTNCAVASVGPDGKPAIVPTADGERVFPSIVSFLSAAPTEAPAPPLPTPLLDPNATDARVLIGEAARRQFVTNPYSTYASTKRLIGRTATAAELRSLAALDVPHAVTPNSREVLLACPSLRRAISPVSVAAELVRGLIAQAEAHLESSVRSAVVTVPAYFDDSQRCATETACLLAGLERVRLLREPEAAALSYALEQRGDTRIMVFDLGGGTFDVSILDVGSGVVEVIASSGDPRLGGNDWDLAIANWLEELFLREHGRPLDGFARRRLLDASEAAKVTLSTQTHAQIEVPFLVGNAGVNVTLSRRKFEALCRGLLLRLVAPMREVADVAGIELDEARMGTLVKGNLERQPPRMRAWKQQVAWRWRRMAQRTGGGASLNRPLQGVPVSKVLLVGGATRMPAIGRFIKRMTGLTARPSVDPEEAVALGAAVQAGILDGRCSQAVFNPYGHERAAQSLANDPNVFRA